MSNKIRLLLDEMYTGFKEYLEVLGWEAVTVEEVGLKGAPDSKIVKYAEENNLLLVTEDQKLADLADISDVPYVLVSKRLIAKMIDSKIREKYA